MTLSPDLSARMRDPNTRQAAIVEFADFFRDLILFFGGEMKTAARIQYEISIGMERELAKASKREGEGVAA